MIAAYGDNGSETEAWGNSLKIPRNDRKKNCALSICIWPSFSTKKISKKKKKKKKNSKKILRLLQLEETSPHEYGINGIY